ncbi:MAG: PfkB family carbohydrate kinase [Candidatus Omnitrophota bacterium]
MATSPNDLFSIKAGFSVTPQAADSIKPAVFMEKFGQARICVLGEGILDGYLYGTPRQLCREAPVPVIGLGHSFSAPGGAANTAVNAARLGAEVYFLSVLGKDDAGKELGALLRASGVKTEHVLFDRNRSTLHKQRVLAGSQMLLRLDKGTQEPVNRMIRGELLLRLEHLLDLCGAFIVSDYSCGVMTPDVIRAVVRMKKKNNAVLWALDARSLSAYEGSGFNVIKPNYSEAVKFLGLPPKQGGQRIDQLLLAGDILLKKTGAKIAAVTLDQDGALIFEDGQPPYRIYARSFERPNTAGAGDTFISAFMLALCAGADSSGAAETASLASAIAVGKKETTASCSQAELKGYLSLGNKEVADLKALSLLAQYYHSQGRRIVFTNGCFDILHRGHIHFLNACKTLGEVLIVGVNSDDSIRKIKGALRPINSLQDRIQILGSLSCIDHVMGFEGDAPLGLIEALKPHVFVKGANHDLKTLQEVPLVKKNGGDVCCLPYWEAYSTGSILKRVSI